MFHDESLSSILQFNPPTILESPNDPSRSERTSIILSRQLSHRSAQTTSMLSIKSEVWKPLENVVPLVAEEKVDTPQENGDYLGIVDKPSVSHPRANKTGDQPNWLNSFRHNFQRFRRVSQNYAQYLC